MSYCHPATAQTTRLVVVAAVLVVFSSLALYAQGSNINRRAHLSADLTRHQARHTTRRERVIVHGTDSDLDGLASRYRLKIIKRMHGAAVVLANSAELSDLSLDRSVDHLSGDVAVNSSTITRPADGSGSDTRRKRAALSARLGIPGVDGRGIGIAVVDSGIAPHSALGQRIVANVSFISGDAQVTDDMDMARTSPASSPAAQRRLLASRRSMSAESRLARGS